MAIRSLKVVERFAPEARALRRHFDERFDDPRRAAAGRFVWDYWHVPGQYTVLRTPAWQYFPKAAYERFHNRLVWWGRRTLGCHDVSPPWLSCYVDGCRQELHGDLPHGPFAFVFSLTPEPRRFRGGETLVLKEEVLDFWRGFSSHRGLEEPELLEAIAPRFNRLTVFDARMPHAVRRVEGADDPRDGRLVIHGWFVNPRPFVEGPLPTGELQDRLGELDEVVSPALSAGLSVAGLVSLRMDVSAAGEVRRVGVLADTTRAPAELEPERRALVAAVRRQLLAMRFKRRARPSRVTLPLVFER